MAIGIVPKQRRTFTLSTQVLRWIESKAKEQKTSRSALVDRLLDRYLQQEKEKQLEEKYKALRDILKGTAKASKSLQRKVIPDY